MLDERILRSGNVCVVGNINRDIKLSPIVSGDHLFRDGETSVSSIIETIGGGGANSAFAAAALGAEVGFLGKVGVDPLGERLEQMLLRHGISAHLARDPDHATGTSIALAFESGHRHFLSCLPNNESLNFDDLHLGALREYTHLFRADIWFSEAMLFGGNEQLFKLARDSGMAVSIDLNWDPQWGRASAEQVRKRKKAVRDVLPWVNLAHGNIRELNEFADSPDLKTTLSLLEEWGAEAVVVHMGKDGAGFYEKGSFVIVPAAPVERHMNATGSGDVLSICMMLMHEQKETLIADRLKLANAIVSRFIEGKLDLIPRLA